MTAVNKAKLRKVYLRKRKMLSAEQSDIFCQKILHQVKSFVQTKKFQTAHIFLPIATQNEINTWPIVSYLQEESKQIVVSKSNLETNDLCHYIYENSGQIRNNKWGIPEPMTGEEININELDIVFIPMIVFDRSGHRIGYGKGYYDKFLSQCKDSCIKIGLSMSPPLDLIPYTDPFDIAMDYCITPLKTYSYDD